LLPAGQIPASAPQRDRARRRLGRCPHPRPAYASPAVGRYHWPPADTDADSDDAAPPTTEDAQKAQTDATQGAGAPPQQNTNADADSGNTNADAIPLIPTLNKTDHLAAAGAAGDAAGAGRPTTASELHRQGVHVLSVDQPAPGTLLVAQATSPAALVLALERQGASGWETVAIDNGRTPVVASRRRSRSKTWRIGGSGTIDGGPEPIRFAARAGNR